MRVVLQRVSRAAVRVEGELVGEIGHGLLLLCAFHRDDGEAELRWMAEKCLNLRVFPDAEGKMNLSLREVDGEVLAVSQFTLYGNCRKGRRPSYIASAAPAAATSLYEGFLAELRRAGAKVQAGVFQASMAVELVNDGPVTLIVDRDPVTTPHAATEPESGEVR